MHRIHPDGQASPLRTNIRPLLGLIVVSLTIIAVLSGISFLHFNRQMYQAVYAQNMSSVSQLTNYFTRTFHTKIDSCFQILENAESLIAREPDLFEQSTLDQLEAIMQQTDFTDLGIADRAGEAHSVSGARGNLGGNSFFPRVLAGERYISDVWSDDRIPDTHVLLAIPLHQDGEIVGALYGSYLLSDIVAAIETDDTSHCYFHIVDEHGHYISRSNSDHTWIDASSSDLWSELARYDYHDTTSAAQIQSDIEAGLSGTFYCTYQGDGRYGSYQPIGLNQWYVFSLLPEQDIAQYASTMRQISLHMLVQILLCLAAGGLIPVLYIWRIYYVVREKNTALEIHNRLFQLVLQKTNDIPFEVDLRRHEITLYSPRFVTGSHTLSLSEIRPSALYHSNVLAPGCYTAYHEAYNQLLNAQTGGQTVVQLRFLNHMTWFQIILLDVYRVGQDVRVVGVMEYYEEQKQKDLELERRRQQAIHLSHRSQHDFLTGLLNREAFEQSVDRYLAQMPGQMHVFLILDIDHFKEINDTMGHTKGDEVLRDVAEILRHQFRRDDIIARLGGDEFVILLKNIDREAVIEKLAAGLRQSLRRTYTQNGVSLSISASIGIARTPIDGTVFSALYPKADAALYTVKRRGKDSFHIYHSDL